MSSLPPGGRPCWHRLREERAASDKRLRAFQELSPREGAVLTALLAGQAPQDIAAEQYCR